MAKFKKFIAYLAVYVIAIGAGSVIAGMGTKHPALSFLAIQPSFGFEPFTINLVVVDFTFGLNIHFTVAHIIMLIITLFVSPKLVATLMK
ncbi:MAG: DUF4321 domain-containing protein [Ruminococcus sp.]|nr:DUF4321 domain-containing protein [Ruminococcus sp.]